ncbi:MAG: dihydrofolate reductase family protein [Solirubrobacterales bacterium]|nr:dihydrofolate reductase family protein [Solirubrobacterales bacterium]HRV60420.1 dihydrofolate reductase family protein [Solirubrobacterales bacterium]
MRRLFPDPGPTDLDAELDSYLPIENPPDHRPRVAVNMVTTLDGRAAQGGNTKQLGSKTDTEHLLALRTRFDAVMIGGGTMRAERYGRIISRPENRKRREEEGLSADALAVIVSGDLDLPFDAPLFTDGSGRVLIFTRKDEAPQTETPVDLITVEGLIDTSDVLTHLRVEENVRAVLCEGGPRLFGQLVAGDLIDDFFLTTTPVMTGGDAPHILEGNLPDRVDFRLESLLEADGDLFARYGRP